MSDRPLIVQSDRTMLLDVHSSAAAPCRDEIAPFSELVKSPEHLHTYLISAISLWNACSSGLDSKAIIDTLERWSRFSIPEPVDYFIRETCSRYGIVSFAPCDERTFFVCIEGSFHRAQLLSLPQVRRLLIDPDEETPRALMRDRGVLKLALIAKDYPVQDLIPLKKGPPLALGLRSVRLSGSPFTVRPYQKQAFDSFWAGGRPGAGYGAIVLPCGSGKTIVGLVAMACLQTTTLILAPNVAALHQWRREILDKTTLDESLIGEYSALEKEIRPVTLCTYSMLAVSGGEDGEYRHLDLMEKQDWGLVIYDEVHVLPAPVFRFSANLQAVCRLGLTATLVREDGREKDVFTLVGPKRYDVPWSELEKDGYIAKAWCHELRVPLADSVMMDYATASGRGRHAIAATNPAKLDVVAALLERHSDRQILIIGQYLDQLDEIRRRFGFEMITGRMPNARREELYDAFREGRIKVLIVSKVANYAIDLPDASVAIQVSGTYGSRQEEAQRLGRILRPKEVDSHFYTLVSRHTVEESYSLNRQKFLVEQGYSYEVENWS